MKTQQPEALRLADKYEVEGFLQDHRFAKDQWCSQAAVELRRLHAENQELHEQMAAIGAGGVEPLRKQAAQQELDALEPQVPDDFLAVETKPFGQLHVGRNHKEDHVWHTNSEGTFWCGDWRSRTPAELERECLSTVKDLRALAAQAKKGE